MPTHDDRSRPSILVVDDESIVRRSVERVLRDEPYAVDFAASAEQALELIGRQAYDLVITDLMMPGLSGLDLLRRLEQSGRPPGVIMITGYATIKTAMEALRLGAFEYIAKPFSRQELQGAVLRALRNRSSILPGDAGSAAGEPNLYSLRGHSWVRVVAGGEVLVGFEAAFLKVVGEVSAIELPERGAVVIQGRPCASLSSVDGHVHGLWAPVAGKVVALNESLRAAPALVKQDPYGEGWVLRLVPEHLEQDLKNLTQQ